MSPPSSPRSPHCTRAVPSPPAPSSSSHQSTARHAHSGSRSTRENTLTTPLIHASQPLVRSVPASAHNTLSSVHSDTTALRFARPPEVASSLSACTDAMLHTEPDHFPSSFSDPGHGHYTIAKSALRKHSRSSPSHQPLEPISMAMADACLHDASDESRDGPPAELPSLASTSHPSSLRHYSTRSKSVSFAPHQQERYRRVPSDTVSEPGHSPCSSTSASSDRYPHEKSLLSHHSSTRSPSSSARPDCSSEDCCVYHDTVLKPLPPLPPHSLSTRSPIRRLRKASRPSLSSSMTSASSSSRSSRLWRALSIWDSHPSTESAHFDRAHSLSGTTLQSDDGTPSFAATRPIPTTRYSQSSAGHSSTTTSSTSSTFASASSSSTPVTTPELNTPCDEPIYASMASAYGRAAPDPNALSSRASLLPLSDQRHEPRKLKKKRPAPLESATVPNRLRKSKSMEKQRATSLGFLPPVRPEEPFRMSIPRQYQGSAESSPVLPHKNSSQALADLAWTGLSSSALARLTARLNVQAYSPERAAQMSEIDLQATLTAHPPGGPSRHERPSVSVEGSPASTLRPLVSSPLTGLRTPHAAMSSRSSIISGIYSEPDPHGSFPATRRWTLAMADVDDDVLVQELDRLRKEEAARARGRARRRSVVSNSHTGHNMREYHRSTLNWPESPRSSDGHWRDTHFGFGSESGSDDEADETIEEEDGEEDDSEDGPVNAADEAAWKSARRALLCCRELVRTERSYQTCLRQLLATQSGHPLAPLLNAYIPALISASEALLGRLVDDPSAWGVSAAFIGCEEELEAAFVAWGGVVGEFFTGQDGAREREKRGRKVVRKPTEETPKEDSMARSRSVVAPLRFRGRSKSTAGPEARGKDEHQPAEAQRSSMFELKGTGMFTAALGTGLPFGLAPAAQQQGGFGHHVTKSSTHVGGGKSPGGTLSRTLTAWKRKSMPSSLSSLPTLLAALSSSPPASPTEKEKMARDMHGWDRKLTVRDLAIQPTQRVMRYVLQYRDLLEHTPISSPSRGLVERALDSAVRIAQKCDRAQGNSAFLRRT